MAHAPLGAVLRQLRTMAGPTTDEEASDRELVERFCTCHDEAAFTALLRRHGPMVLRVCRRVQGNDHDAEDAFQATFLLFARKASSIRKQEAVASWLHGVAHRLAREAVGQGFRRQARERRAADMRRTSGVPDKAWQELQATLDEALRHVPDKYRAPLLLCYLNGQTQEEAARQLGCPLGTVRSRLARGRQHLKAALEDKGIRLTAAGLAAALAASSVSAGVPASLMKTTARAALAYVAGATPTAVVSARAAALLEGGLRAMTSWKLKVATAVLAMAGLLGVGTAVLSPRVQAVSPDETAKPQPPAAAKQDPPARAERTDGTFRIRVLDASGKPVAGAKLELIGKGDRPNALGVTAADGRFAAAFPKETKGQYLVARADGAGLDFLDADKLDRSKPVEFRLVPDRVIRGRIIDTQGKPVAGVRVTATSLGVYANNSLDQFLAEWKTRHFMSGIPGGGRHIWLDGGNILAATTDADGRFTLAGMGDERLVTLRVHGNGIADAELWVVNRAGFDPKPYNEATRNNIPKGFEGFTQHWILYGPDLVLAAEAEKPIRGTVTERATGKPRPGVTVRLTRAGNDLVPVMLSAKTDAAGRYEIRGSRKYRAYMVEIGDDATAGFLACQGRADDTPGYAPITIDVRVAKGVIVTGKVIDKTLGKPVPGFGMAAVLSDNPFVKDYPEFGASAWFPRGNTGPDGTFRVVTIPGPVLLMGGPDYRHLSGGFTEGMKYKLPAADPRFPQYFNVHPDHTAYIGPGGGMTPLQGNFCKVLQIKPGTAVVHEDIVVEQLRSQLVLIRDEENRPIKGAYVTGIGPRTWNHASRIDTDACPAYFDEPAKPRIMVFYEPGRKLFGVLKLKGDEKVPAVVRLGPGGGVQGRLRTKEGLALADVVVEVSYTDRTAGEIFNHAHRTRTVMTDATGAFRIDDLIPGVGFKLYHRPAKRAVNRWKEATDKPIIVEAGAPRDLGDVTVKQAPGGEGE